MEEFLKFGGFKRECVKIQGVHGPLLPAMQTPMLEVKALENLFLHEYRQVSFTAKTNYSGNIKND